MMVNPNVDGYTTACFRYLKKAVALLEP